MKAFRFFGLVIAVSAFAGVPLRAQTATFEGLGQRQPVPNGYAGVDWSSWFAFDPNAWYGGSLGAKLGACATSGNMCADNGAHVATISSATPFSLQSGNFMAFFNGDAGGYDTQVPLTVTAYLGGSVVGSQFYLLDPTGPQTYNFNFTNVDRVTFDPMGANDYNWFLADDLQFGGVIGPVPEPTSIALLGTGLIGVYGTVRRRRARR